jgi:hypothetical protein
MRDISDAADLLTTARDALTRDLLPSLSKEQRYIGLMIANAMAIALREVESAAEAEQAETARLRALLGAGASGNGGEEGTRADLAGLRRQMRDAIRRGRFDSGEQAEALSAHLGVTAAAWVAISNPKALRAA